MENSDTGILLDKQNITLHRQYFKDMVHLIGIQVLYKAPTTSSKQYDDYGELNTNYTAYIRVGCIFDEHPNQWTMKKLGWNSELSTTNSIIHVPYDLVDLQAGCLFVIPSGLDKAQGRVFKVIRMSTISVYPASISCEIGPVFENELEQSTLNEFTKTDFNLLKEEKR